jgi:hypothetical protein
MYYLTINGKNKKLCGDIINSNILFVRHLGGNFFISIDGILYLCQDDILIKINNSGSRGEISDLLFVINKINLLLKYVYLYILIHIIMNFADGH